MKNNPNLPQKLRDDLKLTIIQRKWTALQKLYKAAFYNPYLCSLFPFYDQMDKLFTDYATEHMNQDQTREDVTAFVKSLLDETVPDDDDVSLLRCEMPGETRKPVKNISANQSRSEASKVLKELAKLPKDSVSVQQGKMRIMPNTPFNRHCQLSTILNHRNVKRSDIEPQIKKQSPTTSNSFNDISIINTADDSFDDQQDYQIEALSECDLTDIEGPEVKRIKIRNMADRNLKTYSSLKSITLKDPSLNPKMDYTVVSEQNSILEVPSFRCESIVERIPAPAVQIVPKKLIWNDEPHQQIDQPPIWFKNFLTQYNVDMKKLNRRLDEINLKLNNSLNQ